MISWLDASVDEQRRMRELAALFTQRESRDELGLGQIRDSISDALFPGTSTLHTRARYLLFVPWCFQYAARAKPARRVKRLDEVERAIIRPLRESADPDGLLGLRAGAALKNLPSSVYWSMLRRYEILSRPVGSAEALDHSVPTRHIDDDGAVTMTSIWSVPPPPAGFPYEIPDGFALTPSEAGWLRDHILEHASGTLLTHFTLTRPETDSSTPWSDAAAQTAPKRAALVLRHAEDFSTVMHGAQLLYNYLLAVDADRLGAREESLADTYREQFELWAMTVTERTRAWRFDDLHTVLRREHDGPVVIAPGAQAFVRAWSSLVQSYPARALVDLPEAQQLIRHRERIKGAKMRLGNAKRLAAWSGAAGSEALTYRWNNVRRIMADLHDGLQRA
ncbi:DUF6361 family protein [Microbacterium sp. Mu-80]|uniref:DUF6361 family protein n=1 Tax=Microbacterium bandirmense TaxID=3122050 RepID=A0ABU8LCJ0_9MICO